MILLLAPHLLLLLLLLLLLQDHPKVLGPDSKVGFTNFPDWTYSPVKNSVDEARSKIAVGAPGRTAVEGELEFYGASSELLRASGVPVPDPGLVEVFGFRLRNPPHIVFHPDFAVSLKGFQAKFPTPSAVRITARSTLVVEGSDVTIEGLDLDGTLLVKAAPGAKVGAWRPHPLLMIMMSSSTRRFAPVMPCKLLDLFTPHIKSMIVVCNPQSPSAIHNRCLQ